MTLTNRQYLRRNFNGTTPDTPKKENRRYDQRRNHLKNDFKTEIFDQGAGDKRKKRRGQAKSPDDSREYGPVIVIGNLKQDALIGYFPCRNCKSGQKKNPLVCTHSKSR